MAVRAVVPCAANRLAGEYLRPDVRDGAGYRAVAPEARECRCQLVIYRVEVQVDRETVSIVNAGGSRFLVAGGLRARFDLRVPDVPGLAVVLSAGHRCRSE